MSTTKVTVQNRHSAPKENVQIPIGEQAAQLLSIRVKNEQVIQGKSGNTCRLHLDNGSTVIATRRKFPGQNDPECMVLEALNKKPSSAPHFVAKDTEGLFIYQDVKGELLARRVAQCDEKAYASLMVEAIKALAKLHRAGSNEGLDEALPVIGSGVEWRKELISYPARIGEVFNHKPELPDIGYLMELFEVPKPRFIKWDARPTKARIVDEKPVWIDWERAAARNRLDDLVWLLGDETLPEFPKTEQKLIEAFLPYFSDGMSPARAKDYFYTFGVFHMAVRLGLILRYKGDKPWWSAEKAMLHPEVAATKPGAIKLCLRAHRWCQKSSSIRIMAPWYKDLAKILSVQK